MRNNKDNGSIDGVKYQVFVDDMGIVAARTKSDRMPQIKTSRLDGLKANCLASLRNVAFSKRPWRTPPEKPRETSIYEGLAMSFLDPCYVQYVQG